MGIAAGTGLAAWAAPYRLAGAQTPAGESPKYGGVLTQDTFADPPHFDLHQSETITALLPLAPCYSRLIQPDPFDVDKLIPIWPSAGTSARTERSTPFICAVASSSTTASRWPPRT
jgi:hypothetical protein